MVRGLVAFFQEPGALLRRAWRVNSTLALAVLLHLALVPLLAVVLFVDPREIGGTNGWYKPLKFALSGAVYGASLLWLLTLVQGRRRLVLAVANITGGALIVETALITLQVVRNTASHFNMRTPFDGILFSLMGFFILLLALANFVLTVLLTLQRLPDPVRAWGIRWGLIISLAGMVSGVWMSAANLSPASLAAVRAGQTPTVVGAHSVGVEDGGPGLPFLGWSTTGGDLRVSHFVGLHGLQVLPFCAFLLTRPWAVRRLGGQRRAALVWAAGLGYLGVTLLLLWQALRAQPLLAPDSVTWLAAAAVAAATAAATAAAVAAAWIDSAWWFKVPEVVGRR